MNSNQVKGFLAGIIAAVCYGTNPLGTLELYHDGFSSGSVLTYRYLLAVVMFAIVLLVRRESFAIKWGHAIRLACLGSFFALSSTTLYVSFHYMAAGIASTLLFVYPIMTAILMTAFFHEKVTWTSTIAILLAVSGVGLLYQEMERQVEHSGFCPCDGLLPALCHLYHLHQPVEEQHHVECQIHLLDIGIRSDNRYPFYVDFG